MECGDYFAHKTPIRVNYEEQKLEINPKLIGLFMEILWGLLIVVKRH